MKCGLHCAGVSEAMVKTDSQSLRKRQSFSYRDNRPGLQGTVAAAPTASAQASFSQQVMPDALADANIVVASAAAGAITGMPAASPSLSQAPKGPKPEATGQSPKTDPRMLQMPKQHRSATSAAAKLPHGQIGMPAHAGSSVATAKGRAQPVMAAPGSAKAGAQSKPVSGSGRAQLLEKYKTEAAARKQAHTEATIERADSVAETLQRADSVSIPGNSNRHTPAVRKQQAAAKAVSASGHVMRMSAHTKGTDIQESSAERQERPPDPPSESKGGSGGSSAHTRTVPAPEMMQSRAAGRRNQLQLASNTGNK